MRGIRVRLGAMAVLVLAGCTGGGDTGDPDPTVSESGDGSVSSSASQPTSEPIGTGSDAPVAMATDPSAIPLDGSPEAMAEWICLSLRAAPEEVREPVFERLVADLAGSEVGEDELDAALVAECGDVVAPLR